MNHLTKWTVLTVCLGLILADRAPGIAQAEGVRQRRIIVNDDGEARPPIEGQTIEDYMALRFKAALGTQVDSYFLCVASTDRGPGDMEPPHVVDTQILWFPRMKPRPDLDRLTRAYLRAAREADIEIFASLRLNDCHDANTVEAKGPAGLTYPLKVQRPDLLLAADWQGNSYPHLFGGEATKGLTGYPLESVVSWFFCGFDWAKDEVRQHFLDFILTYCRQYDLDGIELDYGRHPMFFKFGEERQNLGTMTDFVHQVRRGLNQIGQERGKPYLLAIRVNTTPGQCLRTGLDVPTWLAQGLMDMLIVGSGTTPFSARQKELIDMAHQHGVPAYPCINHLSDMIEPGDRAPARLRAMASNFWAMGGDGVYLFNWDGVPEGSEYQECLRQMGSPHTLVGSDKHFQADNGFVWFPYGWEALAPQFPVGLTYGTPIELLVGDDLQKAAGSGATPDMRLQVKVKNLDESEGIQILINDVPVPHANVQRVTPDAFEARAAAAPFRRGINSIVVLPGPGCVGRVQSRDGSVGFAATVEGLGLVVHYGS